MVKEIDKEDLLRCVVVGVMDLKGGGGGGVYLYGVLRERERESGRALLLLGGIWHCEGH